MDQRGFNETFLTTGLLALGAYFSFLLLRGFSSYLRFRRLRSTALVIWAAPRPAYFRSVVTLGVVSAFVAALNTYMNRPVHHVVPQGLMSLYFVLMVPLMASIPLGLYRDGVWAEAGFLSWEQIGRLAFRESPEIVLILLPRTGSSSFRLRVPPGEYGAVRKTLEDKVREHVLQVDRGMLGL
jgi:hypothetical protein